MKVSGKLAQKNGNRRAPGEVRDAIVAALRRRQKDASVGEIHAAVEKRLGKVATSSVRSYLQLGTDSSPRLFTRVSRGRYKLARKP
jgi:site-specific DNA-methyltransferase (adenine-specific)